MRGEATMIVSENDTAAALGSGDVEVLGTPRLIALCEQATVNALTGSLDDGASTVGITIQFDHLKPTPVGDEVVAEAVLEEVDGRRLTFNVLAEDSGGPIGAGTVTRAVVDVERFMSRHRRT
jgi:predicted thioesterase